MPFIIRTSRSFAILNNYFTADSKRKLHNTIIICKILVFAFIATGRHKSKFVVCKALRYNVSVNKWNKFLEYARKRGKKTYFFPLRVMYCLKISFKSLAVVNLRGIMYSFNFCAFINPKRVVCWNKFLKLFYCDVNRVPTGKIV